MVLGRVSCTVPSISMTSSLAMGCAVRVEGNGTFCHEAAVGESVDRMRRRVALQNRAGGHQQPA
jgi:hypothetical protein